MDNLVMDELSIQSIFLFLPWMTPMDELGVGLFYNTPSIMINDFFYFYFMFILFAMLRIVMI